MDKRKCRNCKATKDNSEFKSNWYSKKWTKLYKPYCKVCIPFITKIKFELKRSIIWIEWTYEEYIKTTRRAYYDKNREQFSEYNRKRWSNKDSEEKKVIIKRWVKRKKELKLALS